MDVVHPGDQVNDVIETPTRTWSSSGCALRSFQVRPTQLALLVAIWNLIQAIILDRIAVRVATPPLCYLSDYAGVFLSEALFTLCDPQLRSRPIWHVSDQFLLGGEVFVSICVGVWIRNAIC
ncbi:MAG: hypothetical protein IN818_04130 [Cutibacterium sp.]|nr:hypothetical protein [Cutibacterium sp.]